MTYNNICFIYNFEKKKYSALFVLKVATMKYVILQKDNTLWNLKSRKPSTYM